MSSLFRESYSYYDEQGQAQTIRFSGRNKRDTDAKFQEFLCGPQAHKPVPTLREYVDTVYRTSYIDGLAATTRRNYERYLQSYILKYMGHMPLDRITLATIQQFYDWLANAKGINEKSITRIGALLSRMLTIAAEMQIIQGSPFKVKLLKNNGKPAGHHKALPDDEVDRVKREIPLLPTEQQRLYMGLLVYTGLRREEILGLGWKHIDFQNCCGSVERVVVYPDNNHPVIKDQPKTKSSERPFIIPQPLLEILRQADHEAEFIIHGENPNSPMAMSSFTKMYTKAFHTLRIDQYNNHDWRTTLGTQLKEAGMTSAQVADILGHADTRMVETVYARRRHEGVMKHKDTLDLLNQDYVVAPA